jgi:hypothetical protein
VDTPRNRPRSIPKANTTVQRSCAEYLGAGDAAAPAEPGPTTDRAGGTEVTEYLFLPEVIGLPVWLVAGLRYHGADSAKNDGTVVLREPGGSGRVSVPKAWVRGAGE